MDVLKGQLFARAMQRFQVTHETINSLFQIFFLRISVPGATLQLRSEIPPIFLRPIGSLAANSSFQRLIAVAGLNRGETTVVFLQKVFKRKRASFEDLLKKHRKCTERCCLHNTFVALKLPKLNQIVQKDVYKLVKFTS